MKVYELDWNEVNRIVDLSLKEDIGTGDLTTELLFPEVIECEAVIKAKEMGVLAGLPIAKIVFEKLDSSLVWEENKKDGDLVSNGDVIVSIKGSQKHILTGERLALNILQRLSGIATLTSKFVKEVEGFKTKIVDTRKTVPGLRALGKYAVVVGGGFNHRFGLFDGILIKDNHIKLSGGIAEAVSRIRARNNTDYKIEVETTNIDQVKRALDAGADIIMLDNMSIEEMKEAVSIINGNALTEGSGGITLERVRKVAETGVDIISVGALTHSAQALDISLDML